MNEEPCTEQADMSASPPPPLSLSDITAHETKDGLGHSDVTESITNPVEEGEAQKGSTGFKFDGKDEKAKDLSRATIEETIQRDQRLESENCNVDRVMSKIAWSLYIVLGMCIV